MLVTGAMNHTPANRKIQEFLRGLRARRHKLIRQRLQRAAAEGELTPGADIAGLASFYATVLDGLAIQARDRASRKTLERSGGKRDGGMGHGRRFTITSNPRRISHVPSRCHRRGDRVNRRLYHSADCASAAAHPRSAHSRLRRRRRNCRRRECSGERRRKFHPRPDAQSRAGDDRLSGSHRQTCRRGRSTTSP